MEEREGGRRGKEEDREKRARGGMRAGEGKVRVLKIGERGEEIKEREGRKRCRDRRVREERIAERRAREVEEGADERI